MFSGPRYSSRAENAGPSLTLFGSVQNRKSTNLAGGFSMLNLRFTMVNIAARRSMRDWSQGA
jgi:hypothetical protein